MSSPDLSGHNDDEPIIKPSMQACFKRELERIWKGEAPKDSPIPPSDFEYLAELQDLKPYAAYVTHVIADQIPRFYQSLFVPGRRFTLAFLPFTKGAQNKESLKLQGLWEKFLTGRGFFYTFTTDLQTHETWGFGDKPGRFYELLCDRLRKDISEGGCSFDINYPDRSTGGTRDPKEWLAANINTAIDNLNKFMNESLADTPNRSN